jgi:aspartate-semialdehyde dehydrogenase
LPKDAAVDREPELAALGHFVCTNASAHRMVDDVPLLLPEVNAEHIHLLEAQRKNRNWTSGALIANSNCTTMPVVMSLKPLTQFGIGKLILVSEQAISGAGYPGISSLDIIENVIPFVPGDEGKMETETRKMLGQYRDNEIIWHELNASATCTRVPVIDGHLVNISVELENSPTCDEIIAAWKTFEVPDVIVKLPSAPKSPVVYLPQQDRPQIRRDRNNGGGMATSVGRIRECSVLGYKYAALTHNTIRGAAGCSILNAEYAAAMGYIDNFMPQI